ncbi:MAG: ATP-binding cassette domain-containing protein [Dongiaceae bacterium]
MPAEPILEARGLWKSYAAPGWSRGGGAARRPALIDASLALARGEVLGVVGESGSGKTTLARCLALLARPDRGSVHLAGEDLTSLPAGALRRRRRRIQTVFQDPFASLNPRLAAGEAIAEVLRVHRLAARGAVAARVARLLDLVGLPRTAASRYPGDFSGGQRQRICIARALAAEPEVLIADEAVSALDVSIRAQILNLLLDLRDELGLSMVFIGHDLFVVDFVAGRVAVMLGGQIVEMLPGARLDQARHPYTRELLAAAPTLSRGAPGSAETAIAGGPPPVGCPYLHRCPHSPAPRCRTDYPPLADRGDGHLVAAFCED